MKSKRNIYCDYRFWEAFFDMENKVVHDRSKRKLWDDFYAFLSSNNLFFNISRQAVDEQSDGGKNLGEISRKRGGAGIKFLDKDFPQIQDVTDVDDNILNSVFLTMLDLSECESLSRKFGIIIYNLPMVFSAPHVFIDNGIAFYRANGQNWSFLMPLNERHPSISCCNSLIIADRYLLYDNKEDAIRNNLRPIFEAFLPDSLENNISFTICIIAEYNIEKCSSINDKINKFNELLKSLRPNLNYKLNIYHSWLHDRSILTNNVMLISGAGFDVIGANDIPLKFTTTSLCFPFLYGSNENTIYLDWINNILNSERKCRSYQVNYWGEKTTKHHLLDYYYEEPPKLKEKKVNINTNYFTSFGSQKIKKYEVGTYCKGKDGRKDFIIQQSNGFRQEVRSIRGGEQLNDGDIVEYELRYERSQYNPQRKFYFALDAHLKTSETVPN